MPRPRRPRQTVIIRLTLILERGVDDDLINLYTHLPPRHRAAFTKRRLRERRPIDTQEESNADDDGATDSLLDLLE